MSQFLKNPFHIYWVSYLFVFLVYNFGWANLYPSLTMDTITFFAISSLIAFILGFLIGKIKLIGKPSDYNPDKLKTIQSFLIISISLFLIEFIILWGIPLFELFVPNPRFIYSEFGIFGYHALCISFSMFCILFIFNAYMKSCKKHKNKILFYYFLAYIPAILIINRNMIMSSILACFFLFIHYKSSQIFKPKIIISIVLFFLMGLYLFGLFGNIRSFKGDDQVIVNMAGGTKEFRNSIIPNEYFWSYLYISSPTANLQNSINVVDQNNYDFTRLFLYEFTPRKISQLIVEVFNVKEPAESPLIVKWLNMSGVYGNSYLYAKWIGVVLMFLYTVIFIFIFILLIPKKSKYHLMAISVVSTIILLNTFANFFYVMTVSFELFILFIFAFFENKKFIIKTKNEIQK
jgi:hypothetical protein